MFALHSIAIIFHQKPEATTSTAKGGGSTFNGIYSPTPAPPPPRRKSFQIKVTVSIFKLVKVPAILNTKFRFDGSMVGGGGGSGSGGGKQEPVTRSEQLPC